MAKKSEKSKSKASTKKSEPKIPKEKYVLKKDVTFSDGVKKKGQTIWLTKEGATHFKKNNLI